MHSIKGIELSEVQEISDPKFLVREDPSFDKHCMWISRQATITMQRISIGPTTNQGNVVGVGLNGGDG